MWHLKKRPLINERSGKAKIYPLREKNYKIWIIISRNELKHRNRSNSRKNRIPIFCRAEPADKKTDPRSQRNRKPPSFVWTQIYYFCFFTLIVMYVYSSVVVLFSVGLVHIPLPPWQVPPATDWADYPLDWFLFGFRKNKSNCFLFLKDSIKNGVIPGNFHLLPDDRFKANVFYRNPVFGLCNASQTPVFSHSAEDTTPRFRKTQSSNALGIFGGQCREPLVRSALPAAVNRRGELQQPRAFLLLYYRLCPFYGFRQLTHCSGWTKKGCFRLRQLWYKACFGKAPVLGWSAERERRYWWLFSPVTLWR